MSPTINPETVELRQQVNLNTKDIAELRGNVQQLDKLATLTSRQSTLQIAAIVISLCLTLAGGLYFQTTTLDRRLEQLEKRLDGRIDQLSGRIDQVEKRMERLERNLDDLNKELRTQRPAPR